MQKRLFRSRVQVWTICCSSVFLATTPSLAQDTTQSTAQIDALIADIKAHKQSCDDANPNPPVFCANEKAELIARQKRLSVSDDALTDKLKTRGWRWP